MPIIVQPPENTPSVRLPGFNANEARAALTLAMTALSPQDAEEKVTFHFKQSATYDGSGTVPYRKAGAAPVKASSGRPAVQVPCAVEYADADGKALPFGGFAAASRLTVTVLDTYWPQVEDCTHVVVGGDTYRRRRTPPAAGIGELTVHTLIFVADEEG